MAYGKRILILSFLSVMNLGIAPRQCLADALYNITNLSDRVPIGINNQGQVGLGGTVYGAYANGNAYGGWAGNYGYFPTVSLYNSIGPNAGMLTAPSTSGPNPAGANGSTVPWVNNAGDSTGADYSLNAYVNIAGVQQQIGFADPKAINNADQVVGYAFHAFLYSHGQMQDLGTLGGHMSAATAINDSGVIVGWSQTPGNSTIPDGPVQAFVYQNGGMQNLTPFLLGNSWSHAYGINSSGAIVGDMSSNYYYSWHAFLLVNGKVTDLNSLLPSGSPWVLEAATGINDLGQIIGVGTDNGVTSTFLLTPAGLGAPPDPPSAQTPEPTSFIGFSFLVVAGIFHTLRPRRESEKSNA
jgi:probable HAF family extracellular repeat protein